MSADKRAVDVPGTPVLIIGAFGHGDPPPWVSLPSLSKPIELPVAAPRQPPGG